MAISMENFPRDYRVFNIIPRLRHSSSVDVNDPAVEAGGRFTRCDAVAGVLCA